ncbi:MAG: response regulator [Candidatus Bathyarchaeota archaeon]|nr:response regulator [Candidatus Bathyarchaeota archaeon]
MSFPEKIDVLDLIINVLNEHEKKMDKLVERLELIVDVLVELPEFSETFEEIAARASLLEEPSGSVLIVDDDEFLTETFKLLLEDAGFEVETANTGNQALLKASQLDFDLAILDLKLPDTTGSELAKSLKDRNSEMNIILLTGQAEALENLEDVDLSLDEILLKPISPTELLKLTEKLRAGAKSG